MRYIEVTVNTPEEEIDRRCEEIAAFGVSGFVIENEADFLSFLENNRQYWDYVDEELNRRYSGLSRIKCYLTDDEEGREQLRQIRAACGDVGVSFVEDSDWENGWRENYKPQEVGERLVVVPSWEEIPEGGRVPLRLEPGLAFGTGSHPTTRLCLAAMERFVRPDTRVLDLGCGLNGLGPERLQARAGDLIADASLRRALGGGYDLVLANIVSDVIIALSPHVPAFLKRGGVYISSGIIDGREQEVLAAIEQAGFTVIEHRREEEWHCFVARKP